MGIYANLASDSKLRHFFIPLCNIAHYSYIIMIESVTYLFVVHGNGYNMNHFTDESLNYENNCHNA